MLSASRRVRGGRAKLRRTVACCTGQHGLRGWFLVLLVAGCLLSTARAEGKETDQFTDRLLVLDTLRHGHERLDGMLPPVPAQLILDAEMTRLLRRIETKLAQTAARTQEQRVEVVRDVLQHPLLPELVTPYEEWITHESGIPLYYVAHRGIFGQTIDFDDMRVAWWVQLAPSLLLANVLVGADKPGHFLGQGFQYYAHYLKQPPTLPLQKKLARVRRYAYHSELGNLGVATGGIFSYADLASNWDGLLFYLCLFDDIEVGGSRHSRYFVFTADGSYRLARPFRWAEWVTADWDEVLNPNAVMSLRTYRKLSHALRFRPGGGRGESICDSFRRSPRQFLGAPRKLRPRQQYVTLPRGAAQTLREIDVVTICADPRASAER